MQFHNATALLLPIQQNYGAAGAMYAKALVTWRKQIKDMLLAYTTELAGKYQFNSKERYWAMTMATLVVGAAISNYAGITKFNLVEMREFVEKSFERLRVVLSLEGDNTISDGDDAQGLLVSMLSDLKKQNSVVFTDRIHYGAGPPPLVEVHDTDTTKLGDVWAQVGKADGRIRVRAKPFKHWMREHKQHPANVLKKLEKHYVVVAKDKQAIGVGVPMLKTLSEYRVMCIDFVPLIAPGSNPGSS